MNLRGLVYGDSTMLATSSAAAGASLFAACMLDDGRTGRHLEEAEHDDPPLPRRDDTSAGIGAGSSGIGSHSSSSASTRFSRSRRASAARHFSARPSSSRRCAQRCSSSARCASRLTISSCSAASSASRPRPSEPSHADGKEVVGTADIISRELTESLRLEISSFHARSTRRQYVWHGCAPPHSCFITSSPSSSIHLVATIWRPPFTDACRRVATNRVPSHLPRTR